MIDAVQVESQLAGAEHSRLILDALRLSTITADCLVSLAVAFCMKKNISSYDLTARTGISTGATFTESGTGVNW